MEPMDDARGAEILDTVARLRVTDIRDGMDWVPPLPGHRQP